MSPRVFPHECIRGECESCRSYNCYPGTYCDLCTFGFDGDLILYVNAIPDQPVAATRGTRGRLESIDH